MDAEKHTGICSGLTKGRNLKSKIIVVYIDHPQGNVFFPTKVELLFKATHLFKMG